VKPCAKATEVFNELDAARGEVEMSKTRMYVLLLVLTTHTASMFKPSANIPFSNKVQIVLCGSVVAFAEGDLRLPLTAL
jgi:hypothetical protein